MEREKKGWFNILNDKEDTNTENRPTNKKKDCVKCDYTKFFTQKQYLQFPEFNKVSEGFTGLKYLVFSEKSEVPLLLKQFCEPCLKFGVHYAEDEAVDEQYVCGDTNLLISHKSVENLSKKQMEELEIRLKGLALWGRPMRSSGMFSNYVLNRYFARDDYSFFNQPNSILIFSQRDSYNAKELRDICKSNNIGVVSKTITGNSTNSKSAEYLQTFAATTKSNANSMKFYFINEMAKREEQKGFVKGYSSAKDFQYNDGYNEGVEDLNKEVKTSKDEGYHRGFRKGQEKGEEDAKRGDRSPPSSPSVPPSSSKKKVTVTFEDA